MALIVVASVSAVNVDCGENKWYDWDAGDCVANELQPVFDEVTGMIDDIDITISENNDAWLAGDGKGTSMNSVQKFLFGDFFNYLKNLFVTREEFDALEDKMYEQEARIIYGSELTGTELIIQSSLIEMKEKGLSVVDHKEYTCSLNKEQIICLR